MLENDQLFEYMGLEIFLRDILEDPGNKTTDGNPANVLDVRIAMGTSLLSRSPNEMMLRSDFIGTFGIFMAAGRANTVSGGHGEGAAFELFSNVCRIRWILLIFKTYSRQCAASQMERRHWIIVDAGLRDRAVYHKERVSGVRRCALLKIANDVNPHQSEREAAWRGMLHLGTWRY